MIFNNFNIFNLKFIFMICPGIFFTQKSECFAIFLKKKKQNKTKKTKKRNFLIFLFLFIYLFFKFLYQQWILWRISNPKMYAFM